LAALPYKPASNCASGHYYMLDNTNPGYLPNGSLLPAVQGALPPSPVKTIGDGLDAKNISWAYFGGSYNDAVIHSNEAVAANLSNPSLTMAALNDPVHALGVTYCQICNPFQYASSIMGVAAERTAHIKDTADLIADIQNNTLPAVSVGKPDGLLDGHPQSSKIDLFEAYVENVLAALKKNPQLKATTAVFITWDEAGGYWDSGFVQIFDYFGDGTRIPLLVLSPYSTGGKIDHAYADHVSLLKFIERNWHLPPLTDRSRDNFPNAKATWSNPYVSTNMPALPTCSGRSTSTRRRILSPTSNKDATGAGDGRMRASAEALFLALSLTGCLALLGASASAQQFSADLVTTTSRDRPQGAAGKLYVGDGVVRIETPISETAASWSMSAPAPRFL
jgi:phospholipase C